MQALNPATLVHRYVSGEVSSASYRLEPWPSMATRPLAMEPQRAAQPGLERPLYVAAFDPQEMFALRLRIVRQPGSGDGECEVRRAASV